MSKMLWFIYRRTTAKGFFARAHATDNVDKLRVARLGMSTKSQIPLRTPTRGSRDEGSKSRFSRADPADSVDKSVSCGCVALSAQDLDIRLDTLAGFATRFALACGLGGEYRVHGWIDDPCEEGFDRIFRRLWLDPRDGH